MALPPSSFAIGRRIQLAREALPLTQAELAGRLDIASHQSISDLEKGLRRIQSAEELARLANVLGKPVDYFIDPFSLVGEAEYSWRRSPGTQEAGPFEARAEQVVGLLRWLRAQDEDAVNPLKSALRLSDCSTFEDAERAGERLCEVLKLGSVPAEKLLESTETQLDIPVLHLDMGIGVAGGSVSGATVHLGDFTCILINREESRGRRHFDLAHEIFHALTWDAMPPEPVEANTLGDHGTGKKARIEKLADQFAAALLMPRSLLEPTVQRVATGNVEQLRALAQHFGVSTAALAYRLFHLQLIDRGTRDALKARSAEDPARVRPALLSRSFAALLSQALQNGRLSPRKAAKLLGVNLGTLEGLLREWGQSAAIDF